MRSECEETGSDQDILLDSKEGRAIIASCDVDGSFYGVDGIASSSLVNDLANFGDNVEISSLFGFGNGKHRTNNFNHS